MRPDRIGQGADEPTAAPQARLPGAPVPPEVLAGVEGDFASAPAESIDTAVMEKADKVAVVPAAMGWSDIGSWEALHRLGPLDGDGNGVFRAFVAAAVPRPDREEPPALQCFRPRRRAPPTRTRR